MHKPMDLPEEGLAVMAAAGDHHAFNKLAASWNRRIYNFALRYLGNHDDAQEAAQQTFIKAFHGIGKLQEGTQFRAWLYVIAGNTCRDALRRSARVQQQTVSVTEHHHDISDDSHHPGSRLARADKTKLLKQALDKLPEEQRVVLILKEYEELKFSEIAHILQVPENTVKTRLYRALQTMRVLLKNYEEEK
jgi:RNA polymerase sigma-70 factor (ECF subfamily)